MELHMKHTHALIYEIIMNLLLESLNLTSNALSENQNKLSFLFKDMQPIFNLAFVRLVKIEGASFTKLCLFV